MLLHCFKCIIAWRSPSFLFNVCVFFVCSFIFILSRSHSFFDLCDWIIIIKEVDPPTTIHIYWRVCICGNKTTTKVALRLHRLVSILANYTRPSQKIGPISIERSPYFIYIYFYSVVFVLCSSSRRMSKIIRSIVFFITKKCVQEKGKNV